LRQLAYTSACLEMGLKLGLSNEKWNIGWGVLEKEVLGSEEDICARQVSWGSYQIFVPDRFPGEVTRYLCLTGFLGKLPDICA